MTALWDLYFYFGRVHKTVLIKNLQYTPTHSHTLLYCFFTFSKTRTTRYLPSNLSLGIGTDIQGRRRNVSLGTHLRLHHNTPLSNFETTRSSLFFELFVFDSDLHFHGLFVAHVSAFLPPQMNCGSLSIPHQYFMKSGFCPPSLYDVPWKSIVSQHFTFPSRNSNMFGRI